MYIFHISNPNDRNDTQVRVVICHRSFVFKKPWRMSAVVCSRKRWKTTCSAHGTIVCIAARYWNGSHHNINDGNLHGPGEGNQCWCFKFPGKGMYLGWLQHTTLTCTNRKTHLEQKALGDSSLQISVKPSWLQRQAIQEVFLIIRATAIAQGVFHNTCNINKFRGTHSGGMSLN